MLSSMDTAACSARGQRAIGCLPCAELEIARREELLQLDDKKECPCVLREIVRFLSILHMAWQEKAEQREALRMSIILTLTFT